MVALGVIFGLLSIGVVATLKAMGNALETTVAVNSGIGSTILGLYVIGIFLPRVRLTPEKLSKYPELPTMSGKAVTRS